MLLMYEYIILARTSSSSVFDAVWLLKILLLEEPELLRHVTEPDPQILPTNIAVTVAEAIMHSTTIAAMLFFRFGFFFVFFLCGLTTSGCTLFLSLFLLLLLPLPFPLSFSSSSSGFSIDTWMAWTGGAISGTENASMGT